MTGLFLLDIEDASCAEDHARSPQNFYCAGLAGVEIEIVIREQQLAICTEDSTLRA